MRITADTNVLLRALLADDEAQQQAAIEALERAELLRTPHGETRLGAGEAMAGHGADVAMEASVSGAGELDQLVMFVVDADRPFSSPAAFE